MFHTVHLLVNRDGASGKYFGKSNVSDNNDYSQQKVIEGLFKSPCAFGSVSEELCEKALMDAKSQLHSLLQQVDPEKLDQRRELVEAFKHALERAVSERIVLWLPCVKAVYKFENLRGSSPKYQDNTIHLLILLPRLLPSSYRLGAMLDHEVLERLKRFNGSRFQDSKSFLEIQQVTPNEIHHGVCYDAMFYSL